MDFPFRMLKDSYRTIFIVDSLKNWQFDTEYRPETDLVLTLDYGLKRFIESISGEVYYLDSIGSLEVLQENNLILLDYLQKWFLDYQGKDLFQYRNIDFGKSLRITFWSELLFFVRLCISLEEIISIDYESLIVTESANHIKSSLVAINIPFEEKEGAGIYEGEGYYFDIHRYMKEALDSLSFRLRAVKLYESIYSRIRLAVDELFHSGSTRISVQVYHPTLKIIDQLRRTSGIQVITSGYVPHGRFFSLLRQRLILAPKREEKYAKQAESILKKYRSSRVTKMVLKSGTDISKGCFDVIDNYVSSKLPGALGAIDAAIRFHRKLPLGLNICISSIGVDNIIFNEVSKARGVQTFFIANGLLNSQFGDEGLDFDYINCYSSQIKTDYFNNSRRALPLGDPRMDSYGNTTPPRMINRRNPTIVIGASGYASTDLTSFMAIEFEFLSDILDAIIEVSEFSEKAKIVIKVRPNGFLSQYEKFIDKYFPKLNIFLVQNTSMIDVFHNCDLYISIASQTLFEASCLGIPVIYYKNDREVLNAPFDSRSELPTFHSSEGLAKALRDFSNSIDEFGNFQDRKVMEKYVGPLDGLNLSRNLEFIALLTSKKAV